ncbi:N-acetylmuramoyl-L-alanine amidase [Corallococcus sp. M34]|uniref:N-acetylmuramoyl-L-alanine amidase n=1 Tax=Citreicoccus inhibens TaxID=2849499 RepID=UPI001C23A4F7|nr:N-acetylmuramoyl-L-alanine amidase [Citreicoccus inhibens]MBU8897972.1 N-acetylmuramoyl-L-alanine amidase [Citreicoccus inhibens]
MVGPFSRILRNTVLRPLGLTSSPKPTAKAAPSPTPGPTPKPTDTFEPSKKPQPTPSPSPGPAPTPPQPPAPLTPPSTDPTNPTPPMVVRPSKNFNDRPAGQDIDSIVLHHTADGSDTSSLETLTGKSSTPWGKAKVWYKEQRGGPVSAHYVIGKDGTIYQLVGDQKRAWHAGEGSLPGKPGDVNNRSIGIEIVNEGDGKDAYTEAQYKALEKLVPYLAKRYDVPVDNVVGHKDITSKKHDPSPNFDFDRITRATEEKVG